MMKMKLPMKTGEKGGDGTAEDESLEQPEHQQHIPTAVSPSSGLDRLEDSTKPFACPSQLDKETVFEWFGLHLNPARRIEFMCGLLHMCQPLELRFLGSYLEDLARKDYHVLRDFEFRANSPSDLGVLTDVVDPVIRSKLLVCLSLLGSDSRECAGILFRILSHVDPALFYKTYDYSLPPFRDSRLHPLHPPPQDGNVYGRPEQTCGFSGNETATAPLEQLALLFTMASLHPAFHFHQREVVRGQLDKIELAIEEENGQRQLRRNAQATELMGQKTDYLSSPALGLGECSVSHQPCQNRRSSRWAPQREAVHIEGIALRGITRTRIDKEYNFEVKWSDDSSSTVTKTHLELENFLLKLPKDQCTESFEKSILTLLNQGDHCETREMEKNLRERFLSAPPLFRQTRNACIFFNSDSSYSTRPTCCRCNCQAGKAYQGDCSDASSQEEDLDLHVQGHKKKHGSKSPCLPLSSTKGSQADTRRGGHPAELNGPSERRKKSCTLRCSQEAEQHQDAEKRNHPVTKTKSRVPPADRDKGKARGKGAAFVTNGSLVPALSSQRKDVGPGDIFGETSSESYSSPSSPQHRGPGSLDSEDDHNKDTDSHSDDCNAGPGPDMFFTQHTDPAVVGDISTVHPLSSSSHQAQMEPLCPETGAEFPPLSFMHSLPFVLPNGATDSGLPLVSPPSQNIVPDGKPSSGTLMMQMPLVPPAGIVGDPEKRDVLPTFGIPPLGLHPPGTPAVQPLVQRFQTALSLSPGGGEGAPGSGSTSSAALVSQQGPGRAMSVMSPGPTSFSSSLLPCQDPASICSGLTSALPHVETSHTKHPGLTLPSGMPSPYALPPMAPVPTSVMPTAGATVATGIAPSPGHLQTAVPPAVPTHTPGPAPSPSPALTHSTAHSDSTSYSNSSTSCGSAPVAHGNAITLQQTQQQQVPPQQPTPPQQQQPPMGCGTCGCHNNCGGRGTNNSASGASGCQTPLFFPAHQMAAAARHMFNVPPPVFQLASLCSSSYLTQAHPPHQANGTATLPPFFPTGPPPAHPPSYLHTHSHSHAEVSSHMLGTQAAAVAAAAANYSLQQQMAPGATYCQRVYQHIYPNPLGMLPAAALGGGGVNKNNGTVSCYNCGVSGHYSQDCNQPSIDSTQQAPSQQVATTDSGTFGLRIHLNTNTTPTTVCHPPMLSASLQVIEKRRKKKSQHNLVQGKLVASG
ncbi:zinc finger CCHC domain-containing protein 2 isoform X2 [Mugil cephalus]|uniref:zinc finger CCHC domain-containing protein 2 isoform X2 n=1 Tax=Mugil cephalus TaxID=48193 RepID=UPI001FB590AD|nr:zinc finger CCHC domain-containing protein 2 isoform X2 [Mugil cephalus]